MEGYSEGGLEGIECECGGDGLLDRLADPVDGLVLLPDRLAQFAEGWSAQYFSDWSGRGALDSGRVSSRDRWG